MQSRTAITRYKYRFLNASLGGTGRLFFDHEENAAARAVFNNHDLVAEIISYFDVPDAEISATGGMHPHRLTLHRMQFISKAFFFESTPRLWKFPPGMNDFLIRLFTISEIGLRSHWRALSLFANENVHFIP